MRSPDAARRAPFHTLLAKELWGVLSGRALWTMLLILCPLVGYSFFQAVSLYGEASSAARDQPALASGLSPLDGVLVPTFGALYVAVTLLFPFVAIRTLGREKETGALRLLIQLPYRVPTLIVAKMTAISLAWLIAVIPALSALAIWAMLGGHLHAPETLNLLFGQLLYGLLVGAIALFAASVSEGSATAAIVALAFTIGSWVLDFALAGQPGLLEWIVATVAHADASHFRARTSIRWSLVGFGRGHRRLCRARRHMAASRRAGAQQAHRVHGLRRPSSPPCSLWRPRSEPRSISPRIDGIHFRRPISARWPSFASRCSSPCIWHRRTRAMSTCDAMSWPSSNGCFRA